MMKWCVIKLQMERGFKIWRAAANIMKIKLQIASKW
jgi:hypothetical protein